MGVDISISKHFVPIFSFLKEDFYNRSLLGTTSSFSNDFLLLRVKKISRGPSFFVFLLILIWALRLALYLGIRSMKAPDDPRYLELAKDWRGNFKVNVLVRIFYAQFIISLATSLSITLFSFEKGVLNFTPAFYTGFAISIFGLIYETIADVQLFKFKRKKDKNKKVMDEGLWSLSRHPNYFGEILFWWGIWISTLQGAYWYIGLISPLTITYLLTRFSGVPMLEKRHKDNPEYLVYIRSTNTLIPGPKKMKIISTKDLNNMESRFRARLVNSLSGVKSANLIGSVDKNKNENLSIVSSCFHLGASPALMGMIFRRSG